MDDSSRACAGLAGQYLDDLLTEAMGQSEAAVASGSIPQTVTHLAGLKAELASLKAKLTLIQNHADGLSEEVLPTMFANQNIKTITIPGAGRATVVDRWSCSMPNKEAAMAWLRESGNGGMVSATVHPGTLAAFAKDRVMEGKPLPEMLFKVSASPHTSITK